MISDEVLKYIILQLALACWIFILSEFSNNVKKYTPIIIYLITQII